MSKISKLDQAKMLLTQALSTALSASPNDRSVIEATQHIKNAIHKIEDASQHLNKKKASSNMQFQDWWGHVQAGIAAQPMNAEAQQKSLKWLNNMIAKEESKLKDLEVISNSHSNTEKEIDSQLIQD